LLWGDFQFHFHIQGESTTEAIAATSPNDTRMTHAVHMH
jgi:hypothetical protein